MDTPASSAILVLGMHRSGTSALAHLLQASGADLGERLVPGSAGNEQGHWEDAFAVETHERLLAALGRRWDDVRPLPDGWREGEAARKARSRIVGYVRATRLRHRLWAAKDPRMCLFAALWRDALQEAGCTVSSLLLARHPAEVAASLAARDGMADAQSHLLWLRYMLEAERATRGLPRVALTYDALVASPDSALAQIRALPGGDALQGSQHGNAGSAVQAGQRHHHSNHATHLPLPLDAAWAVFAAANEGKALEEARLDACAQVLERADGLYAPVVAELERAQATLWQRAARAESAVAEQALAPGGLPARDLAATLAQLREGVDAMGTRLTDAIGNELRRMQDEHAKSLSAASELAGQAALARDLVPGVGHLADLVGGELREAIHRAEMRQAEVAILRGDVARYQQELAALQLEIASTQGQLAAQQQQLQARDHDLAIVRHQVSVLQGDADLLRQIRGSRSWRLTRPLRYGGRLLRGQATPEDHDRIRRGWARLLASLPFLPRGFRERKSREGRGVARIEAASSAPGGARTVAGMPVPAAATGSKPDVFVWAVIDWHFRTQRPQHLARGLAEDGHRVFYLSNNLIDDAQPGFGVEALDDSGRLFQVFLHASGAPAIYHGMPSETTVAALRRSVGELMQWAGSDGGLCIVQHPFWSEVAAAVPGSALLYDCMDHHAGFKDNAPGVLAAEAALTRDADLLVVTSAWLERELAGANPNRALIRNACDFEHFSTAPAERYRDRQERRIIGYYGAIADWFDAGLVRAVARANPDCLVLLVGSDTAGVGEALADLSNVQLVGEVPYDRLPYYLHAFDVALLPFKVLPLTLATNPVKVYEYLAGGKPVVAVELPEMQQFGDLVYRAEGEDGFLAQVARALDEDSADLAARRKAFASEQTWVHRAEELDAAIEALPEPLVSVIVLAWNNLDFTRACLRSLDEHSHWGNLEVIVVDNASTDGTRDFLREWGEGGPGRRVILNDDNLGFAAGNNVGLAAARGDVLVLLNNDTYVTPHWLRTMVNHLRRQPAIGILGPVTNNIGNEARIEIGYADMAQMREAAAAYTRRHAGQLFDLPTVAFFCVAMPRSTYERVGGLDEAFGVGFFEDDDYCRRVEAAGLRVACAEDVFVHHHLSASFDSLKAERKRELFERNKAIYEAKWGPWVPHAYRDAVRQD